MYRIGGDEFIVLSKRLACEEFEKAVEKLRRRFQENDIHISLGVNWRMAGEDLKEAVLSADHLMYQEKSDGKKNRGAHTDLDIYEF